MKNSSLRSSQMAFTLIELLVVIAIIAILAAILFPVFARARENARRSSCQSNMKQISLAFMQYTQDFDERVIPFSSNGGSGGIAFNWPLILKVYIDRNSVGDPNTSQIYSCPSRADKGPQAYAYNMTMASNGRTTANIPLPAQTPMFAEAGPINTRYQALAFLIPASGQPFHSGRYLSSANYNDPYSGAWAANALWPLVAATRHFDGGNYAFADGHVKWLKAVPNNDKCYDGRACTLEYSPPRDGLDYNADGVVGTSSPTTVLPSDTKAAQGWN